MMPLELKSSMHDAALESIALDKLNNRVYFRFQGEMGDKTEVTLFNCEALRIVDFGMQNIVSRIHLHSGAETEEGVINHLLNWVSSLEDAPSYFNEETKSAIGLKIRNAELQLFQLEPSCGAEVVVLFNGLATSYSNA